MKRLMATIQCDIRLQVRNGFYYAVAFLLTAWAILIGRLPEVDWGWLLPALVLGNLSMTTFYFMGGLVLLEKEEGTLETQIVTPLTTREYLASKVITLTALSLVENLVIVGLAYGLGFGWLAMGMGIALAATIYSLVGFVAVARYDSINEYLFPSMLYIVAFSLPFLHYFGLWESWLMYFHPMQAPLILMKAGFRPVAAWEWVYGLLYSTLWVGLVFHWSQRNFCRFIITKAGVR